jgi:glycosyltransferase involved in cell wall biosynthesis
VVLRLLVTITRYWPAIGGAEIHTRELLRNFGASIQPVVAAHWASNRTDWLLGTTLMAPINPTTYCDDTRPVHLVGPTLAERLRSLPLIIGYYPFQTVAAARLGHILRRHLAARAGAVDIVHNVRVGREPLSLGSFELARAQGVPFVLTPNHHPRWRGWRYRVYCDLYRRADALIALTQHERSVLIRLGVSPERVHVTGIGPVLAPRADPDRARLKYGLHDRFVLFLGQKYPYKGAQTLLDAASGVWQTHPDVRFLFVGPRTRHSIALFQGIDDPRVRELGMVDLQDKTDLLSACEVVCVPSAQESFGGVLVEGWSFAKPVVAGPAPAAAEVIDDGVDGFYVPRQSAALITERLTRVLGDSALAVAMGQRGARKVAEHFNWERLAAKTEAFYRQLLPGGSG